MAFLIAIGMLIFASVASFSLPEPDRLQVHDNEQSLISNN
jgi:hypothetical protein